MGPIDCGKNLRTVNPVLLHKLLLLSTLGIPLVLALGFSVESWRRKIGILTPWAAVPALISALWIGEPVLFRLDSILLGAHMGLDGLGRAFLLFTALLYLLSGFYARGYFSEESTLHRFHFFWLLTMAGNFTLILAQDMLVFYGGFALMSFSAYGLIVYLGKEEALRAGRIYIVMVVLGELLLTAGIILLAYAAGGIRFQDLTGFPVSRVAVFCILAGFGIKAGIFPLHMWLPLAHPAAPVPASAILSGAMIKAGLLGWLRFLPAGESGVTDFSGALVMVGTITAFFGAAVGVTQSNPKTVLAYSSISQMGFMAVGMGMVMLGPDAAPGALVAVVLYAIHHSLAKGSLFLGVGMVDSAATPLQQRWVRIGLCLPALALVGAPLTSGALAKTALKAGAYSVREPWGIWLQAWILPIAAMGTTLLMFRFLVLVWVRKPQWAQAKRSAGMWVSWSALLVAVAGATWIWPAVENPWKKSLEAANLWALSWPIISAALLGRWAMKKLAKEEVLWWRRVPAGDFIVGMSRLCLRLNRMFPQAILTRLALKIAKVTLTCIDTLEKKMARRVSLQTELRLRAWPNVGLLLIILFGTCLLLIALG